jgi:hypothetical protein
MKPVLVAIVVGCIFHHSRRIDRLESTRQPECFFDRMRFLHQDKLTQVQVVQGIQKDISQIQLRKFRFRAVSKRQQFQSTQILVKRL